MRYHMAEGSNPEEPKAAFHIQGPQSAEQVHYSIKELLDREGVTEVAVYYNHGLGDRVVVYRKIKE